MMVRKLIVSKKTGFLNHQPYTPIVIRDLRGIMFYDTNSLLPVYKFNLPAGEYIVESGNFSKAESPIDFPLVKLPPKQRNYPSPRNFKVIFGDNPNKCSIIWQKQIIIFDNSFKDEPLYVIDFIRGHEFGHQYYTTEKFADLWSANFMLTKGYNPSQIGTAPITTLTSMSAFERKYLMYQKLTKNGKRSL